MYATRRIQLRRLVDSRAGGNQTEFGKLIKRTPSVVYQYLNGNRNMGERLARHIEQSLRLPVGWMDRDDMQGRATSPTGLAPFPMLATRNPESPIDPEWAELGNLFTRLTPRQRTEVLQVARVMCDQNQEVLEHARKAGGIERQPLEQ